MNSIENYNESQDFEAFCSNLNQVLLEDQSQYKATVIINSIPVETRVRLLLQVLSSQKSYELKGTAASKFQSICLGWVNEQDIPYFIINESMWFIIDLLINEENEAHQQELFSLCVSFIEVLNKDKTNKWEVISEMVIACVGSNNSNLTELIHKLVIDPANLFGNDENIQASQYYLLLKKCLEEFSEKPKVALFAIDVLLEIFLNYKQFKGSKGFSKLVPLILISMETMIFSPERMCFTERINNLFCKCPHMFKNHLKETIRTVLSILYNENVDSCVTYAIYNWFSSFIRIYSKEIKQKCHNYIPTIIENLLNLKTLSYPNNPSQWSRDISVSLDIFLSQQEVVTHLCFTNITHSLNKEAVCPFLFSRVDELLKSSDWKQIATAIDCLIVIVKNFGESITFDPMELIRTMTPYLYSDNTKIMYSTIKLTQVICELLPEKKFDNFHRDALSSIIESATKQSHLLVKIQVLYIVGDIIKKCQWDNYDLYSNGIIKLFLDVMEAAYNSNDNYCVKYYIDTIVRNFGFIYKLSGSKIDPYIVDLNVQLLKLFDKLFFIPELTDSAHDVINTLRDLLGFSPYEELETVVSQIVTYVEGFNKSHNLSSDYLEIQPCFFLLLESAANFRTKSLATLFPKLASALVKFLNTIRINVTKHNGVEMVTNHYKIPRPFGCGCCFADRNDGGIRLICRLVSTLVQFYRKEFYKFVVIYLEIIHDILTNVNDDWRHVDITKSIYQLLECAVTYGDTIAEEKHWNSCLKNTFIGIMKNCKNERIFKLIKNFTNCITICSSNDVMAMDATDIKYIGEILNNAMFIAIQLMGVFFPSEKHFEDKSADTSEGYMSDGDASSHISVNSMTYELQKDMNKLQQCVHDLVVDYREQIIDDMIPMFKTLLEYQPSKQLEIFFQFLLTVVDDILENVDEKCIGDSELLRFILDFCFVLLPKCFKYDRLVDAIPLTLKLKDMFPLNFKQRFEQLEQTNKSNVEKLLTRNYIMSSF